MEGYKKVVFLADDDPDDAAMFEEAFMEVSGESILNIVNDGVALMNLLKDKVPEIPDVIFLDLNMPKKNGFECLEEIKGTPVWAHIPVVVITTSSHPVAVNEVYRKGAQYYITKPNSFEVLKIAIDKILSIDWGAHPAQPPIDKFLLTF